ncbi:hypothetical protein KUV57_12895 [Epibacterium sp. DP7N7-1]|nr:hypothetical protein [Epibacterium sp. DP7N7-1]
MVDLLQIIENLVAAISPGGGGLTGLLFIMSWIIGLVLVMMAIKAASRRSEMGKNVGSWSGPAWSLIIGVCFVALPGLMASLTQTFFGVDSTDPADIFSYAPSTVGLFDEDSAGRNMITGIVVVIQFFGAIAIMRGLLLLRETANGGGGGPKTFGPGFTHVIAGSMAANFPLFVGVVEWVITNGAT